MDVTMTDTTTQALEALLEKNIGDTTPLEYAIWLMPLSDPNMRKFAEEAATELDAFRARIEAAEQERDRLRETLAEVMTWIDNWDPDFVSDAEWSETDAKVRAALEE
jgi:hypothetical protein